MKRVSDQDRIQLLRQRCLQRSTLQPHGEKPRHTIHLHHSPQRTLSIFQSMKESNDVPWIRRVGLYQQKILEDLRLELDEYELLIGRVSLEALEVSSSQLEEATDFCARLPIRREEPGYIPVGKNGHCQLNFDELFLSGITGISSRIQERMTEESHDGRLVLESFLDALAGLKILIHHAAEVASQKMLQDVPEWRKNELLQISEACKHVATHPPGTFFQAIQLMWLTELATMYACGIVFVSPGRIDRHLMGLYQSDIAAGRITEEYALLLIESLYILINEFVPAGGAVAVMVGGRNAAGEDTSNELSYFALEALRRTRLVYPTVGLCWHEETPEDLLDLTIDLVAAGNSNPAIFGDKVIQKGLQSYGVPEEESHHYINSTCVEITPSKSSNVWVASPYFNTCQLLLEEIAAQADSPPADFETFLHGYFQRLSSAIVEAVKHQNKLRLLRKEHGGKPLQSVFTQDCIERARDIDDGGARYNWVECSFVGLANLADSLYVIQEEVFNHKRLTLQQLKDMLHDNYENYKADHARIQNFHPKYGQGHHGVDALFGRMIDLIVAHCKKYKMFPDDSPFIPGAFAFTRHERFGREAGATPDGRFAGTPFADGCGPAQGREKFGPTAAILSTISWEHAMMLGGLAFNMKFCSDVFQTAENKKKLKDLVRTYLQLGGFETQINVTHRDLLEKAQKNPEQYRDLVVRVGGYTDYFTRLTPEMQEEILLRTEYHL